MNQWMIGYGNISEGHTFVGPFASRDEAIEYAVQEADETWFLHELFAPDETQTTEGEAA
jgi:hypothetical protein